MSLSVLYALHCISWWSSENLIVLYNGHISVMHWEMVFSVVSAPRLSWCCNIYWYIVGIPVFIYHGVCRLVTRIRAVKTQKFQNILDNLDISFSYWIKLCLKSLTVFSMFINICLLWFVAKLLPSRQTWCKTEILGKIK